MMYRREALEMATKGGGKWIIEKDQGETFWERIRESARNLGPLFSGFSFFRAGAAGSEEPGLLGAYEDEDKKVEDENS